MSDLLPCPFCGKHARLIEHAKNEWLAFCDDVNGCGTEGWYEPTPEAAIAAWNRRVESDAQWRPVADGWQGTQDGCSLHVIGDMITLHDSNTGYERTWILPANKRLCERRKDDR